MYPYMPNIHMHILVYDMYTRLMEGHQKKKERRNLWNVADVKYNEICPAIYGFLQMRIFMLY